MTKVVARCVLVIWGTVASAGWLHAQDSDPQLPDSPSHVLQTSAAADASAGREVTWHSLPKDFLQDQKAIWLFPTQLAKGHHWLPTLAVVGGTAGLIVADPHVMPYFRSHQQNLYKFNDTMDGPITAAAMLLVPASLLATGYITHDSLQRARRCWPGKLTRTARWSA